MSEQVGAANAESFQVPGSVLVPARVWADIVAGQEGWAKIDEAARRLRDCGLAGADGRLAPVVPAVTAAVADILPSARRLIRLRLYRPDGNRRVDLYTGGIQAVMADFIGDRVSFSLVSPEFVPSWVASVLCLGPRGVPAWESVEVYSPLAQALVDEDAGLVSVSVRRLAGARVVAAMAQVAQAIQAGQWRLGTIAAGKPPLADDSQMLAFLDTTAGLVSLESPANGMLRLNAARTYGIWSVIVPMIYPRDSS